MRAHDPALTGPVKISELQGKSSVERHAEEGGLRLLSLLDTPIFGWGTELGSTRKETRGPVGGDTESDAGTGA